MEHRQLGMQRQNPPPVHTERSISSLDTALRQRASYQWLWMLLRSRSPCTC